MATRLLKGFFLTTSAHTSAFDNDVLYFVRQDAAGNDGYLQFNGKKYGLPSGAIDDLKQKLSELSGATVGLETLVGTLPPEAEGPITDYFLGRISGLTDDVAELSGATISEVSRLDGRIDELSGVTEDFSAATVSALTQLRADMTVTVTESTDTGETPDVKKYLLKQGETELGTIEVPADVFVDKGTLITVDNAGKVTYSQDPSQYAVGDVIEKLKDHAGTYVAIKFANDEGSVVFIDVTKLIDIYTVSGNSTDYLTIEDYKVGVKKINIADATSATTGFLDAWDAKQYIDAKGGDADEKIAELSGVTKAFSAATVAEFARVDSDIATVSGRVDELSAATVSKVVVNGYESTFDDNTATVDIYASGITLGGTVSGHSSGVTVTTVLDDIYGNLSRIDKAAYGGIESADSAITVTEKSGDNPVQKISLKTEEANGDTIAAGHLELQRNTNGELFAVMYYGGDDVQPQS